MKFCTKCGKEILDEAVICPGCGCAVEPAVASVAPAQEVVDEVNIGLCVLAFFIPLFGIIYWPVKHKETPKKARACGITGIVSWALSFISSLIISVITYLGMFEYLMYL